MGEAKRRKAFLRKQYEDSIGRGFLVDISSTEGLIDFARNHIPSPVIKAVLEFCWGIECDNYTIPQKYYAEETRWLDTVLWWNDLTESKPLLQFANSDFCGRTFSDKTKDEILAVVVQSIALLIYQEIRDRWKELDENS